MEMDGRLVSVVLVTDPFGPVNRMSSRALSTTDWCVTRIITSSIWRSRSWNRPVAHHRRNARKALDRLTVEELANPMPYLDTWCKPVRGADRPASRHRNQLAFQGRRSPHSSQCQGWSRSARWTMILKRWEWSSGTARDTSRITIWLLILHGAISEKASYALFWTAAEQLRGRVRWLSLGAGAGATGEAPDGLTRFKRGLVAAHASGLPGPACGLPGALSQSSAATARTTDSSPLTGRRSWRPLEGKLVMTQTAPRYRRIVEHYERCLALHGDSHRGVDWPRAEDAAVRYDVMLGVIAPGDPRPIQLLDFGCGAGHLLEHIQPARAVAAFSYHGLDISERFLAVCRDKFPERSLHSAWMSWSRTRPFPSPITSS